MSLRAVVALFLVFLVLAPAAFAQQIFGLSAFITPLTPIPVSSLAAWYEADYPGNVLDGGTGLSRAYDKSGNGYHADQNTAINQPTYSASCINSRPCWTFDGNDTLSLSGSGLDLIRNVAGWEYIAVLKPGTTGTTKTLIKASIGGGTGARGSINLTNTNLFQTGARRLDADGAATLNGSGAFNTSTVYLISNSVDYTNTTATHYKNSLVANASNSSFLTSGSTSNTASQVAVIGSDGAGGVFFNGSIAAIIVYRRVLSSAERAQVFNYLSAKYGITLSYLQRGNIISFPRRQFPDVAIIDNIDDFAEVA